MINTDIIKEFKDCNDFINSFYLKNKLTSRRKKIYKILEKFFNDKKNYYIKKYFSDNKLENDSLSMNFGLMIIDENDLKYFINYFFSTDLKWEVSDNIYLDDYINIVDSKPFLYSILKKAIKNVKINGKNTVVIYLKKDFNKTLKDNTVPIKIYWDNNDKIVREMDKDQKKHPHYISDFGGILTYIKMEKFFEKVEEKYSFLKRILNNSINEKSIKKFKILKI